MSLIKGFQSPGGTFDAYKHMLKKYRVTIVTFQILGTIRD